MHVPGHVGACGSGRTSIGTEKQSEPLADRLRVLDGAVVSTCALAHGRAHDGGVWWRGRARRAATRFRALRRGH
jgi:hypothetical protein